MATRAETGASYRVFQALNLLLMLLVIAACLGPFLYILALSLSESSAVLNRKVVLWPVGLNFSAYKHVLAQPLFLRSFYNTLLYTFVGTAISLALTVMGAYPLSKKRLVGRKGFMLMIVITMFFTAGLIPTYILVTSLGFSDRIWAIVIPNAINQYYLIIVITYMQGLPASLEEAAAMDGLNPVSILWRIVLPLSKPVLAAIGLFTSVGLWNEWFLALIFLSTNTKYPMMAYLRAVMNNPYVGVPARSNLITITIKTATIILVSVPIIIVYPFLQKYFVQGVMVGSIKG